MIDTSGYLRRAAEILLVVGVLAAGLLVFSTAKAKLDSDEVNKIGTSHYFKTYFVERDFSAEAWADNHWTRTQPMVFRHVIGGWLWLRGHDLDGLNPNYDVSKGIAANRRLGLVPSEELLDDARMVTRLMAALAVTVLYLIVRVLSGPIGGLAAVIPAIGSPYLQEHLIRAKAESMLMFFLLAALLAAILGLRRDRGLRATIGWGLLTGVLLGLAFGTKLTAVLVLVAVALWGAAVCLQDRLNLWRPRVAGSLTRLLARNAPARPDRHAAGPAIEADRSLHSLAERAPGNDLMGAPRRPAPWVWPFTVLAAAGFVFVASNPFLWPDPVGRTWLLFDYRKWEMSEQQKHVPSRAVHALTDRVSLVWDRSVSHDAFGPSRLNLPLEAVLTMVGAVWLAVRAGIGGSGVARLVFLWLACLWGGISVGLGFLLQHYFVPTALIATLLSGLAIGWSAQAAWSLVGTAWTPVPRPRLLRGEASPDHPVLVSRHREGDLGSEPGPAPVV
jgi:hypothetical protein